MSQSRIATINTDRRVGLEELRLDKDLVTALAPGEAIICTVRLANGDIHAQGQATYGVCRIERPDTQFERTYLGWFFDVTMPATPQTLKIEWDVTIGTVDEYYSDKIQVTAR